MPLSKRVVQKSVRLIVGVAFALGAAQAWAHPMGNFSINHYAKITVTGTSVQILYLLDMAEIPTYQDVREYGFTAKNDDPSLAPYLATQVSRLKAGLTLEDDGRPLALTTESRSVIFADGAGGLPTMKIGVVYGAELPAGADAASHRLTYTDNNYAGHAGWKEIIVAGGRGASVVSTTASLTDRSQELTNYPTDLLNSPPQQTSAGVEVRVEARGGEAPGGKAQNGGPQNVASQHQPNWGIAVGNRIARGEPSAEELPTRSALVKPEATAMHKQSPVATSPSPVAPAPLTLRKNVQNTPRNRFTQLISSQEKLGFWVLLSAAFIAAGLGALHALEPGHGKTLVAAYLVGSRGKARHAVLLGLVVTAAHTAGVYLLGLVALYASRYIVPEQLYPWLGMISGLTVAGLGVLIFLRHLTGATDEHSHVSGESHSHWLTSMFKASPPAKSATSGGDAGQPISLGQLCALGITGGIIPCPAALVVLLSAFSLHRIGFGLFLISAFSLGLAAVLVAVGLTMVYAKRFLSRVGPGVRVQRYLPMLSSAFMVILGVAIVVSAFSSTLGTGLTLVSKDKLLPFITVILLGLFLGMRHSTDPDHVVAVSTIISRQGSIKNSATIGALWGLGHTLTIFLVGSAIIIFGVVIPPRLGLAMEFSVALMLILLGVLNLTGLVSWVTERFTPAAKPGSATAAADIAKGRFDRMLGKLGLYQTLRPFLIGLVHGLAGSAAVALLVLSTIKSPVWATAYLLVFGAGTLVGMMTMTIAMSLPLVYSTKRFNGASRWIAVTSGVVSVAFGLFLVYQIGVVDGLFSAIPHWIPS